MLRPELLTAFNKFTFLKLSSDGFTGFQKSDPNRLKYNVDINRATEYLCSVQIDKFAEELCKPQNIVITKGYISSSIEYADPVTAQFFNRRYTDPIIRRLHEFGINLRYLHLVRNKLPEIIRGTDENLTSDESTPKGPDDGRLLEEFLLSIMVCRVLKNHWRVESQNALNANPGKTPMDVVKNVSAEVLTQFCQNTSITNVNVETGIKETGPFWDVIIKKEFTVIR